MGLRLVWGFRMGMYGGYAAWAWWKKGPSWESECWKISRLNLYGRQIPGCFRLCNSTSTHLRINQYPAVFPSLLWSSATGVARGSDPINALTNLFCCIPSHKDNVSTSLVVAHLTPMCTTPLQPSAWRVGMVMIPKLVGRWWLLKELWKRIRCLVPCKGWKVLFLRMRLGILGSGSFFLYLEGLNISKCGELDGLLHQEILCLFRQVV